MQNNSNNRLLKNTILLYIRMFLVMGISLYTSRVVFQSLGIVDFGLYNLVGGIAAIFTSISSSLGVSSVRYITYSIGSDSVEKQRVVFSTTMIVHGYISIIVFVLCEVVGLSLFYTKLVIPAERLDAAFWAFQYSIFTVLFVFLSLPYNAVITAYEKMSIYAYFSVIEVVLRLFIVFLLDYFSFDKLSFYAFLFLFVQVGMQLLYWGYCKLNFRISDFKWIWDMKLQKEILGYSTWILAANVTSTLYTQGLNILINIFFGPVVNAAQGIAVQVQSAIMRFVQNFQIALRPQIILAYAKNEEERLFALVITGIKLTFFLMYIISLPIMLQLDFILKIWLGNVPDHTVLFVNLFIVICLIRTFASPLMIAVQSTNKIKKVQLWECAMILVLPISYIGLNFFSWPIYSVFIINLLFDVLLLWVRIKIISKLMNFDVKILLSKAIIPTMIAAIIATSIAILVNYYFNASGFLKFIAILCVSTLLVILFAYSVAFDSRERFFVKAALYKIIKGSEIWLRIKK